MSKQYITTAQEVPTTGKVLVKFGAAWCAPCKMLDTVLDKFASLREDYTVRYVDIDNESSVEFVQANQVRSIPVTLVYNDGEVVDSFNGAQSLQTLLTRL